MNFEISRLSRSSKKSSTSSTSVSGKSLPDDFPDIEEIRSMLQTGKNNEYLLQTLVTSLSPQNSPNNINIHRSDISLPTFVKQNEKVTLTISLHSSFFLRCDNLRKHLFQTEHMLMNII